MTWRSGLCLAVLLAAGCSGGTGEVLLPVEGRAFVGDKPLKSGTVSFRPDATKGNTSQHQPNGTIDSTGRYELYVPPARKGAPPGWYKVVVTALDDPQPGKPLKSFIDLKYADEARTPRRVEVVADAEPGRYDLKLTR